MKDMSSHTAVKSYRGADKSLARPGRKQAKHQLVSFLLGLRTYQHPCNILSTCKAPREIHAILTETLTCFLPGPAKDLSAPL